MRHALIVLLIIALLGTAGAAAAQPARTVTAACYRDPGRQARVYQYEGAHFTEGDPNLYVDAICTVDGVEVRVEVHLTPAQIPGLQHALDLFLDGA
jgi:hypothetical protein